MEPMGRHWKGPFRKKQCSSHGTQVNSCEEIENETSRKARTRSIHPAPIVPWAIRFKILAPWLAEITLTSVLHRFCLGLNDNKAPATCYASCFMTHLSFPSVSPDDSVSLWSAELWTPQIQQPCLSKFSGWNR